MNSKVDKDSERKFLLLMKWFIGVFLVLFFGTMFAFGIFKSMMLFMFLTIVIASTLFFRNLSPKEDNKVPLMVLGAMAGVIIGGSLVLYYAHERKEMCTPPYNSDSVKMSCLF
ncbi:TPA: hypothetical protein ACPYXD_005132 [Enterobacter hormaechei subsp. xiangfangensis]